MRLPIAFFFLLTLFFSSCATVFSGSQAKVTVNEGIPPKADVYMNGRLLGQTPLTFPINKKSFGKDSQIEIRAEGYKPVTITIEKRAQAGFIVLDVLTGLVWLIVDIADGALYTADPKKVEYKLEKL